jgi:CheY-like chemotaxis protein
MKIPSDFIVIDDDPVNNMICKYTIASFAPTASIRLFTEPEKALSYIQQEYQNCTSDRETSLFLDINMPTMSGWEFLEQYRLLEGKMHSQIDIFILSSSIDPEDMAHAKNHPLVEGYYSKPLSKETLQLLFE